MRWLKPPDKETAAHLFAGALKGATRGLAGGGLASIVTGAAVVATAPAWVPVIGGVTAISMATVAAGSAIGAGVGAAGGAALAYLKKRRTDKVFGDAGFKEPDAPKEG